MLRPATRADRVSERGVRLALVAAGTRLTRDRLLLPGEGNMSARWGHGRVLVTPAGVDKGRLRACDLVELELDREPPSAASSESLLHLAIYRSCPQVHAVVHAHPPAVLRLSSQGQLPDVQLLAEAELLLGGVSAVEFFAPGSSELAAAVTEAVKAHCVCVLHRHGAVAVAENVALALRRMLVLELVARTMEARGRLQ